MLTSERGSLWNRWDLHFHTPSSFDYEYRAATNEQIVETLIKTGVKVVAITDHHVIDVLRIKELQRLAGNRLTILPGIELRGDLGGKEYIHFIGIFPENCDLNDVWTKLSVQCRVTAADVKNIGNEHIYCDLKESSEHIHNLGGIVTIHAHGKSNSIEGIANSPHFKAQLKKDLLQDFVDFLEVGKSERRNDYFDKVFPTIGFELPFAFGSDNHDIRNYIAPDYWLKCDPNFLGLKMIIEEADDRVEFSAIPSDHLRVANNKTKFIRRINFSRVAGAPTPGSWFSGSVEFNPGLVAIIGNKGNGKSALADAIGLLGSTQNGDAFSFLNSKRFCHPLTGRAHNFTANLEWESGPGVARLLSDKVRADEIELVKYLPQEHIEKICNEPNDINAGAFERELKTVIFSHVSLADRLGCANLDELVAFRNGEKQRRIDTLQKDLRELHRRRSLLEARANPIHRTEIQNRIGLRETELAQHDESKPVEVSNPALDINNLVADPVTVAALQQKETELADLEKTLGQRNETVVGLEKRIAIHRLLAEKIRNFSREFEDFRLSLQVLAEQLGFDASKLVQFSAELTSVQEDHNLCLQQLDAAKAEIGTVEEGGLLKAAAEARTRIFELKQNLDEPNQKYQVYLAALAQWQKLRSEIVGSEDRSETLLGLKFDLESLDGLPSAIEGVRQDQVILSRQIHEQIKEQAEVLVSLYGPVQSFIDTHELAKDKLQLEFRVDIVQSNFTNDLLSHLSLNRKGSFMGADEGRARSESLLAKTNWDDWQSVEQFVSDVDQALHFDKRSDPPPIVQLSDQVSSGKSPEDIYNLLYGLDFLRPKYVLRWDGKELSMLSPGERGTLLLVFYLLIDKGDLPLIIDQPEGNLDNHTVAKVLVDCIREARKRRQVFIVTHNPNLAVVCDADQVVHASIDKSLGNAITYTSGSLENPIITRHVTDVLEGTRWAFDVRTYKYDVGELED